MLDKTSFRKTVLAFLLPMAIQNLINVAISSTDVIMLGRYSEVTLSASSLASQVQFILILLLFGIGSGATVLTAQYWGKRDIKSIVIKLLFHPFHQVEYSFTTDLHTLRCAGCS